MLSIFKKSIEINMKIETYLDTISDSLILFEKTIKCYLKCDDKTFLETYERICALETKGDELEKEIKVTLYKYMLLPDTRADVLSLIKSLDNIIDATEMIANDLYIQKPQFPEIIHDEVLEMTNNSMKSAESLLHAVRAFFNEVHLVNSHINTTNFYEHETDILQDQVSNAIFNGDIIETLAEKLQLHNFIKDIASISDEAEIIGNKLTIFTIKREI